MSIRILSINKIKDLAKEGKLIKGIKERKKLISYVKRGTKVVNERLSQLEEAGLNYYAYDRMAGFIDSELYEYDTIKRDSQDNIKSARLPTIDYGSIPLVDVKYIAMEISTFLRSKSSTVEGQRNIFDQRVESLRELGINIPIGQEHQYFDFINSDAFNSLKNTYVASEQLLNEYAEFLQQGLTVDEVNKIIARVFETEGEYANYMYDDAVEDLMRQASSINERDDFI